VLSWPMGHRVLIVVSDGRPSGPADGGTALAAAVHELEGDGGVHLIGVGLGPSTEHVAHYYRSHVAKLPLEAFPSALGALLADLVLAHPPKGVVA
jgi:Mg-chelatase subunit ChlD